MFKSDMAMMKVGRWSRLIDLSKFEGSITQLYSVDSDSSIFSEEINNYHRPMNRRWKPIFTPAFLKDSDVLMNFSKNVKTNDELTKVAMDANNVRTHLLQ